MVTNNKRIERLKKIVIIGIGNKCPKCLENMERRGHRDRPQQSWFYEKWDYCKTCRHLQHYEEFKSSDWKEIERREDFIKTLL